MKPYDYTQNEKIIYDSVGKRRYLILYRLLKFNIKIGMIVYKVHEIVMFEQSKWLEKNTSFKTQKEAKNDML